MIQRWMLVVCSWHAVHEISDVSIQNSGASGFKLFWVQELGLGFLGVLTIMELLV